MMEGVWNIGLVRMEEVGNIGLGDTFFEASPPHQGYVFFCFFKIATLKDWC